MSDSRIPAEVELVYEVMPCNAMRTAQEPKGEPHPCAYFRKWGTYHSYDYSTGGPPPHPGILHETEYVGRAPLVPEVLSGCRKAPIMALGINPNLPGWWPNRRRALNPLFDDYKQYAHYFRYRAIAKLELSEEDYERFGGGPHDTPFSDFELDVPTDERGRRTVSVGLQPQKMYEAYEGLLEALAGEMGWRGHGLAVGEDLAYGNMVACPSAKWTTVPAPKDPALPPMSPRERDGIVTECFRERRYFLRQLFQSLPAVVLVFGQSTANAFIGELRGHFTAGDPRPGEGIEELMEREVRLLYGRLEDGSSLEARVVFAPHITGNPEDFGPARARVVAQLVEEARSGRLSYNARTGRLSRPRGSCAFCPMLEIGPCDYADELRPLAADRSLAADGSSLQPREEKLAQEALMGDLIEHAPAVGSVWTAADEAREPDREEAR